MRTCDTKSKTAMGFLTVVEHPQHGLCGGYLLLNACGRPLEFHCTAPIRANRAQQILYGPTLAPFLYGEQIGQTLLAKAKIEPLVVCTDREPALAVREFVSTPMALVIIDPPPSSATECVAGKEAPPQVFHRLDGDHTGALLHFRLGRNQLAVLRYAADDQQAIVKRLESLAEAFDLGEPFQRIHEAIEEAQRTARQGV